MAKYEIKEGSIEQVGDYKRCQVCFKGDGSFELYEVRTFDEESLKASLQYAADKLESDNAPREESEI